MKLEVRTVGLPCPFAVIKDQIIDGVYVRPFMKPLNWELILCDEEDDATGFTGNAYLFKVEYKPNLKPTNLYIDATQDDDRIYPHVYYFHVLTRLNPNEWKWIKKPKAADDVVDAYEFGKRKKLI